MDELFESGPGQAADAAEAPQVPEKEVRQVRELLQALTKTKRAFEMYPANNPILIKFLDDLNKRFDAFLSENERLPLVVRQYEISYKGQVVYQNTEKEDNLALFFYKDGLRELTFKPGFSGDEVTDFLDVVRARPEASTESYDDDIVTLLWEKDFVNLSYYVVEEFYEGGATAEEEAAEALSRRSTGDSEFAAAYNDAVKEDVRTEQIFSPLEKISMGGQGVFSLGEEEVKSLKEEMEGLTDERFLEGAVSALFESLYLDRGSPDFNALMDNLDSALGYLVNTGGFASAVLIMKRFHELVKQRDTFNNKETDRIRTSLGKAGGEARVKAIAEVLNSGRDINVEAFRQFIGLLDKGALIPLSNLISEIQDIKYRKILIEAVVVLGRDNIESLASGLKDKNWLVVRNVAAILGRIGDKAALDHLRQALGHPEQKVRREIVRSLGMVGGPKAGEILLLAAEDQDPQIRMAALRYLPTAQGHAILDGLMEMITRPDFGEKSLPEKRVFFEVLAEIGQDGVLPFMVKLLRKKTLFSSAKNDEIRVSAAYGLGNIHQREALETLKNELSRAGRNNALSEAISYSIHKLSGPSGDRQQEVEE